MSKPLRITPLDETAVTEGTWTIYMGVELKIARANNAKFEEIFNRLSRPHQHAIDRGKIDEDVAKEIMCQAMSQAILVDWNNFSIEGEEVPYSHKNAYDLLVADSDCRAFVLDYSRDVDNFLVEEEKQLVEKSLITSDGPEISEVT